MMSAFTRRESLWVTILGTSGLLGVATSVAMLLTLPITLPTFVGAVRTMNAPRPIAIVLGQIFALGTYFMIGAYAPDDPLYVPFWWPVAGAFTASTIFLWRYQRAQKTEDAVSPTSA